MKFLGALFLLSLQSTAANSSSNSNSNNNPSLSVNFYHSTDDTSDTNTRTNTGNDNTLNNIAMFFHGGDLSTQQQQQQQQQPLAHSQDENSSFIAMGECAFVSYLQDKNSWENEEDYDDDDEDDDEDDDGHSSMLSNASIRQRVSATGSYSSSGTAFTSSSRNNGNGQSSNNAFQRSNPILSNSRRSRQIGSSSSASSLSSMNQILSVRGGAAAGPSADEFAKRLLAAAAVTVLYEGIIGHIFEFLKIGMQTAPIGTTYMSIMKQITDEKGIAGAWDGFIPWGVVQAIFKGGVFGLAHAIAKTYLTPLVEKGILPEQIGSTLAGGIAGGVQGFVLSPLLLLKTRVMTNPVFRENMTLLKTTLLSLTIGLDVVKNEGVTALMKGSDIFAVKRVFDWSTRYYFADIVKTLMLTYGMGTNGVLASSDKIIASLIAGTLSTFVTLPLDVIVAKSQSAKKAGVKVSAWETFIQDYRDAGWKGLYDANMQGFEVRLVHVCCTTVVMQFGSPLMFEKLFGNK